MITGFEGRLSLSLSIALGSLAISVSAAQAQTADAGPDAQAAADTATSVAIPLSVDPIDALPVAAPVVAEPVATPTEAAAVAPPVNAPRELGAVVVTGVRGAPRTVVSSPVPIDVISPTTLQNTGRTGLKEILGNSIPSLTMPALGGGGTSASVRPITIRGLSGDYLLVLVNGKRRHTTALINNLSRISGGSTPVDVDLIATSGVGRVEVLRDGAAAQYGSDAISGVLNIILDDRTEGTTFTSTAGQHYEKGGLLVQQTLSHGLKLGDRGFIRFSLEGKYHDAAKSSALPLPQLRANGQPNYYFPPIAPGVPDPREAQYRDNVFAGGYGRSNRDIILNTSYNAKYKLTDDLSLYSFSTLSRRDIKDARGAFNPNYSTGVALPEIYPLGFQAYRRIWEWDFQSTAGLEGNVGGIDWDLSSSYGRDWVKLGAVNTLNPSLGPTSPTSFFMGKQIQDLWVNNLDGTKSFAIGFAEPLQLSFGLEHRWEKFRNKAGEPDSYRDGGYVIPVGTDPFHQKPLAGGIGGFGGFVPLPGLASFTGTSPADARTLTRHNIAAYLDVSTKPFKPWFVGAAGRVEHYTDSAGNTVSGKVTTRYELLEGLGVRGGVNTGFRAPSLAQTGFSTTQNTATIIGQNRVSTISKFLPVDSAAAKALGAKPLKPEKSLNYTAGLTFELPKLLRLSVDGYQIDVSDRIARTEFVGTTNNGGTAVKQILESNGINNVDSAQFFTNAIDTRTRGVDVVADLTLKTAVAGTVRPTVAYSYTRTSITSIDKNPKELDNLNVTLFGRQAQRDLRYAIPRAKLVASADWSWQRLHALVRFTRWGKYRESGTTAEGDRTFGAKWITDLDVGVDLNDVITLSAGAYNLFDVYPDKNGIVAVQDGSGQYGNFAPFGLSGGFYYARLAASF